MGKKHTKQKMQQKDGIILFGLPVFACVVSLYFQTNFFVSTFLFFGLLSVWLSARLPSRVPKVLLFSALLAIPVSIIVDYVGVMNGAWYVPASVFPFRLFSVVPIEDVLWGFLLVYNPVMFYCNFFDPGSSKLLHKRMWFPVFFNTLAALFVVLSVSILPDLLSLEYAYLWIGTIVLGIPLILFALRYPRYLKPFCLVAIYFFLLGLLFELVSLKLGHWIFPGEGFIGWIHIFGQSMPIEEFIFWFVICSSATLAYYLFFDTDLA